MPRYTARYCPPTSHATLSCVFFHYNRNDAYCFNLHSFNCLLYAAVGWRNDNRNYRPTMSDLVARELMPELCYLATEIWVIWVFDTVTVLLSLAEWAVTRTCQCGCHREHPMVTSGRRSAMRRTRRGREVFVVGDWPQLSHRAPTNRCLISWTDRRHATVHRRLSQCRPPPSPPSAAA